MGGRESCSWNVKWILKKELCPEHLRSCMITTLLCQPKVFSFRCSLHIVFFIALSKPQKSWYEWCPLEGKSHSQLWSSHSWTCFHLNKHKENQMVSSDLRVELQQWYFTKAWSYITKYSYRLYLHLSKNSILTLNIQMNYVIILPELLTVKHCEQDLGNVSF